MCCKHNENLPMKYTTVKIEKIYQKMFGSIIKKIGIPLSVRFLIQTCVAKIGYSFLRRVTSIVKII